MSEHASQKRHRHDTGEVAHGALSLEETTRSIQGLLGVLIAGSVALTVWTIVQLVI